MFTLVLWRLTFEALNVLKLLGFRGPKTRYFAFGANMDPAVMKRRAMTVLAGRTAVAQGYALKFTHEVPFEGMGMASIEPSPAETVRGMVYTLYKIDEWIMDCYESHRFLNRYAKVWLTLEGERCFCYRTNRHREGLKPSQAYLTKIVTGYKTYFPQETELIARLESLESLPEMRPAHPPRMFIVDYAKYGQWLRPWREKYDELCVKAFTKLIFRPSLVDKWLPK